MTQVTRRRTTAILILLLVVLIGSVSVYVRNHVGISLHRRTSFVRVDVRLLDAVENGDLQSVEKQIAERPAYVRGYLFGGEIPLLHRAVDYERPEIVRALLANGADVNAVIRGKDVSGNGTTAIVTAVLRGNIEIVTILAQHGAKLNVLDDEGRSLDDIAKQMNNADLQRALARLSAAQETK